MGRHSAPDDDAVDDTAEATATVDLDKPRGRHARTGGTAAALDDRDTQMIAVIDPEVLPDDLHDTGEIAPPEPAILPLEEKPAKPSRADRRQEKKAAKAAAAETAAAEKAAAKTEKAATKEQAVVPPAQAVATAEPVAPPAEKAKKRRTKKDGSETNTQADLRLLRENSAVRARCIAAVLVSFLLYTVVMVVLSRADSYLLWLWIPIVVSGFLVGFVLDLAHKAAAKTPDKSP